MFLRKSPKQNRLTANATRADMPEKEDQMAKKSNAGRPTSYTSEVIEKAWDYVNGGWIVAGDPVPSVAGLACEIGLNRETLRLWAKDEENEFFGILMKIAQEQERHLVRGGLGGVFNPSITKMMMTKHGYSDKIENEHSGPNGGAIPVEIKRTIVDPKA
jgi:hypothetical protein